jgi:hypothetical protein
MALMEEHRPICWQCGQYSAATSLELSICLGCAGIVPPLEKEESDG